MIWSKDEAEDAIVKSFVKTSEYPRRCLRLIQSNDSSSKMLKAIVRQQSQHKLKVEKTSSHKVVWEWFLSNELNPGLSSVRSLSRVRLCDPMDCSTPGFPVHHQLSELAQTHVHRVGDAIQSSHPLLSPPPIFSLSQHQSLFQ